MNSRGPIAYADRQGGLTRVVTFTPPSNKERVVASHVCGDAFTVDPWSPDGRSLAIGVSPAGGGCGGHGGVQVAVWKSGKLRRVGPLPSYVVTWSGDGSRLLVAARGGSLLIDPRSGKGRKVLQSVQLGPGAWSRGRRAFASHATDGSHREVVVLTDRDFRRVVRSVLWGTQFAWSPREQLVAVSDGTAIRVIDGRNGKDAAVIPVRAPNGFVAYSVAWSPDGRALTLVASPALGHD
jgi:WD40 repeat protein